jgi:hypothetical protein
MWESQDTDPRRLPRPLRLYRERGKCDAESENDREPDPLHGTFYEALCWQAPVSGDTPRTAAE